MKYFHQLKMTPPPVQPRQDEDPYARVRLFKIISEAELYGRKKKPEDEPRASISVAEREGFEPSMEVSPHTRLAGERLQPARPSLQKIFPIFFI